MLSTTVPIVLDLKIFVANLLLYFRDMVWSLATSEENIFHAHFHYFIFVLYFSRSHFLNNYI